MLVIEGISGSLWVGVVGISIKRVGVLIIYRLVSEEFDFVRACVKYRKNYWQLFVLEWCGVEWSCI